MLNRGCRARHPNKLMARLEHPEYKAAVEVVRVLRGHGHEALLAGGCVRDLLLGEESRDFDVATSACPEEVQALFARTTAIGAHFGVIQVLTEVGDEQVKTEVATFRHDVGYSDGRRPSAVQYSSSAKEDVLRRDFTINGLLLDVEKFETGAPLDECVLDYVGGRADLRDGIVRAIGDPVRRFEEDKLRLIRAVRFAARFGFRIEERTMAAMRAEAANIGMVSAERVREELTRILTQGNARFGFELLDQAGLLEQLLPEVKRMQGVEQPPQFHPEGDVWVHTLMLLEHLPKGANPTLAWGMLLHDVGKPPTFTPPDPAKPGDRIRFNGHVEIGVAIARVILNRLKFSNGDAAQVLALIQHHMQFGDVMRMKQSTLKRFLRLPEFEEHLALHRADVMSSHGNLQLYDYAKRHYEELGHEDIRPTLLLKGEDLIAAGYKPGPPFRKMLEAAEDAQLEGALQTREQALEWVEREFGPPGEVQ
jgi:poly(A) polymerase